VKWKKKETAKRQCYKEVQIDSSWKEVSKDQPVIMWSGEKIRLTVPFVVFKVGSMGMILPELGMIAASYALALMYLG